MNVVILLCVSGAAQSSSLPTLPPGEDRSSVGSRRFLGSAVPVFLLDRPRSLLPPKREPTAQPLQGAARHPEGHDCQPAAAAVNSHSNEGLLIYLHLLIYEFKTST